MERIGSKIPWLFALIIAGLLIFSIIFFMSQFSGTNDVISITLRAPQVTTSPNISGSSEISAALETEVDTLTSDIDIPAGSEKDLGYVGTTSLWSTLEIQFSGPGSNGLDSNTNPFLIPVNVTFIGPENQVVVVPAFFDGDGEGHQRGDVWRVRFFPRDGGRWRFETDSPEADLNNWRGEFDVEDSPECRQEGVQPLNLNCSGLLQYVGEHYLRFENGKYWLKVGLDDPENFLGTAFGDWDAKKAAVDYLSEKGINSIYVILNNIDGDRNDTWSWYGDTPEQAKDNSDRFNLSKLTAWEDFFSYVQSKGIVLHLVLNDDSAWNGYDHDLYLREMIARFGHHPGIIWNIGEEANEIYSDFEQELLAERIQQLDPYDHPVTVHRRSPWPFIGNANFDLTSIQVGDGGSDFTSASLPDYNAIVIEHREQSKNGSHIIPVMIDETPRITRVSPETREKLRRQVIYPILLGGGSFELHYRDAYGQQGALSIQDLEPMLTDMRTAREIIEDFPFQEMESCNELLSHRDNLCFGKAGEAYLIYFPNGGTDTVNLSEIKAEFSAFWVDPRTGDKVFIGIVNSGGKQTFTTPDENDWLLQIY